jgi:hypothetical protein
LSSPEAFPFLVFTNVSVNSSSVIISSSSSNGLRAFTFSLCS